MELEKPTDLQFESSNGFKAVPHGIGFTVFLMGGNYTIRESRVFFDGAPLEQDLSEQLLKVQIMLIGVELPLILPSKVEHL